jgi:hypothetical protein
MGQKSRLKKERRELLENNKDVKKVGKVTGGFQLYTSDDVNNGTIKALYYGKHDILLNVVFGKWKEIVANWNVNKKPLNILLNSDDFVLVANQMAQAKTKPVKISNRKSGFPILYSSSAYIAAICVMRPAQIIVEGFQVNRLIREGNVFKYTDLEGTIRLKPIEQQEFIKQINECADERIVSDYSYKFETIIDGEVVTYQMVPNKQETL